MSSSARCVYLTTVTAQHEGPGQVDCQDADREAGVGSFLERAEPLLAGYRTSESADQDGEQRNHLGVPSFVAPGGARRFRETARAFCVSENPAHAHAGAASRLVTAYAAAIAECAAERW
jgi:soluble lytic murein transglycosylase-like protein